MSNVELGSTGYTVNESVKLKDSLRTIENQYMVRVCANPHTVSARMWMPKHSYFDPLKLSY